MLLLGHSVIWRHVGQLSCPSRCLLNQASRQSLQKVWRHFRIFGSLTSLNNSWHTEHSNSFLTSSKKLLRWAIAEGIIIETIEATRFLEKRKSKTSRLRTSRVVPRPLFYAITMEMILPKPRPAVQYCKKALETRYVCLWKFIKVKEDAIHSWTNSFLLGYWKKKKKTWKTCWFFTC